VETNSLRRIPGTTGRPGRYVDKASARAEIHKFSTGRFQPAARSDGPGRHPTKVKL